MTHEDRIRQAVAWICNADRRPDWVLEAVTVADMLRITKDLPAETEGPQKQ